MRLTKICTALVLLFMLAGCCGGQPTVSMGMPTLAFGNNATAPTTSVPVRMVPDPSSLPPAYRYAAPAAPARAPCQP